MIAGGKLVYKPCDFFRLAGSSGRYFFAYIVKLTAPIEGYIIYVKHKSDARWGQYFLEKSNKFLTEELEVLLEQCATDYDIEIDSLSTSPFENSSILGVFSIDSYKLKTE